MYPTLLSLHFLFFAEETQRPLFFLQIILSVIAIFFFIYVICRTFPLRRTRLIEFLMSLFLVHPNYNSCFPLWSNVCPEAICYPLFLFGAGNILLFLKEGSVAACKRLVVLTTLLVLARPQFRFVYAIFGLFFLSLFSFWRTLLEKKQRWSLILWAVTSLVVADLAERSYHLVVHGRFRHVAFSGQRILTVPTILLGPDGEFCLDRPEEKALYAQICRSVESDVWWGENLSTQQYAHTSDLRVDHAIAGNMYASFKDPWEENDVLASIATQLIRHHPAKYIRHIFKRITTQRIGWENPYGKDTKRFLVVFFVLCVAFLGCLSVYEKRAFLSAAICCFCNHVAISMTGALLVRFTKYTDSFFCAVLMAIFASRLPIKKKRACCNL
jgi:hypothetical protein